ncbi:MAG: SCP2 sterol-binding domain-containing protein [Clostridiales bacterium]|nr:SCP2 sterol-binding domain-containing protein [Clostridiales bacterium]
MTFTEVVNSLSTKLEDVSPSILKGVEAVVYQFELTGEDGGIFHIEVEGGKALLNEAAHDEPDVTVIIACTDFGSLLKGELDAASAFMSGRLKVKGDLSLAIKLQNILG